MLINLNLPPHAAFETCGIAVKESQICSLIWMPRLDVCVQSQRRTKNRRLLIELTKHQLVFCSLCTAVHLTLINMDRQVFLKNKKKISFPYVFLLPIHLFLFFRVSPAPRCLTLFCIRMLFLSNWQTCVIAFSFSWGIHRSLVSVLIHWCHGGVLCGATRWKESNSRETF